MNQTSRFVILLGVGLMISLLGTSCTSRSYQGTGPRPIYRGNAVPGYNSSNTWDGGGWKVTQSGSATKVGYIY